MSQLKKSILIVFTLLCFRLNAERFQSETNITSKEIKAVKAQVKTTPKKPEVAVYPEEDQFPLSLLNLGSGKYFSKYAILLDKKNRTLSIWSSTLNGTPKLIEAFPSDMGRVAGDKQVLGDLKTPEGIYFFQSIYKKNQLNFNEYGQRAFTTNYPNLFDKRNKKTGSGIWLHAIPPTKTLFRGSRGCIVVRNDVITKFNNYISLKDTPFVIEESVNYIERSSFNEKRQQLTNWLSSWVKSWKNKELENYMNFYNDDFYSQKMTKKNWRKYKKRLNQKYSFIDVSFEDPVVYKQNDKMIIKFIQNYKSDTINDSGEKTLHLISTGNDWKIIAESWKPLKKEFLSNYQTEKSNIKSN